MVTAWREVGWQEDGLKGSVYGHVLKVHLLGFVDKASVGVCVCVCERERGLRDQGFRLEQGGDEMGTPQEELLWGALLIRS